MKKLEDILKHKGVGPQGSKSLSSEDLESLTEMMLDSSQSLITRATLLTAFLLLPNNEEESTWLTQFRAIELPPELSQLLPENFKTLTAAGQMDFALSMHHKIAQQKELSPKEAGKLAKYWLHPEADPILIATTLEGLRLRRETFDENLNIWNTLLSQTQSRTVEVDKLVDIADIYNGQNRFPLLSPALACLLSAADMSVSLHGVLEAPPKFGITVHKILLAAGVNPLLSLEDSAKCLEQVGWTYTDQSVSFPELNRLLQTRIEMVKRPCLATFEKLLQPLRHPKGNDLICGYTHKGYRDLLPKLAKESMNHTPISAFLNLKGLEGGPMTPGNRATSFSNLINWELVEGDVKPEELELEAFQLELDKERTPEDHLAMNLKALSDPDSLEARQIHYWAAVILSSVNPEVPAPAIARTIGSCLKNGSAQAQWDRFIEFHQSI